MSAKFAYNAEKIESTIPSCLTLLTRMGYIDSENDLPGYVVRNGFRFDESKPLRVRAELLDYFSYRFNDAILGLRMGALRSPLELGTVGYLLTTSATLGELISCLIRYFHLISDHIEIELTMNFSYLELSIIPRAGIAVSDHHIDHIISAMVCAPLLLEKEVAIISEVGFIHDAKVKEAQYISVLGCSVNFLQSKNYIRIPKQYLKYKLTSAEENLHKLLKKQCDARLKAITHGISVKSEVIKRVEAMLNKGEAFTLERVAKGMNISASSLQERLRKEGRCFREIVQDLRKEYAIKLLIDTNIPLTEIPLKLGYTESSTFYQAFKRWTGHSPACYRNKYESSTSGRSV